MGHMATYLVEISSKADFKNIAQQPDIILTVRTEIHKRKKIYYIFFFSTRTINIAASCRSVACWRDFVGLLVPQNLVHKKQFMSWDSLQ